MSHLNHFWEREKYKEDWREGGRTGKSRQHLVSVKATAAALSQLAIRKGVAVGVPPLLFLSFFACASAQWLRYDEKETISTAAAPVTASHFFSPWLLIFRSTRLHGFHIAASPAVLVAVSFLLLLFVVVSLFSSFFFLSFFETAKENPTEWKQLHSSALLSFIFIIQSSGAHFFFNPFVERHFFLSTLSSTNATFQRNIKEFIIKTHGQTTVLDNNFPPPISLCEKNGQVDDSNLISLSNLNTKKWFLIICTVPGIVWADACAVKGRTGGNIFIADGSRFHAQRPDAPT